MLQNLLDESKYRRELMVKNKAHGLFGQRTRRYPQTAEPISSLLSGSHLQDVLRESRSCTIMTMSEVVQTDLSPQDRRRQHSQPINTQRRRCGARVPARYRTSRERKPLLVRSTATSLDVEIMVFRLCNDNFISATSASYSASRPLKAGY